MGQKIVNKILGLGVFLFLVTLFSSTNVFAADNNFVSIVIPVRGSDYWQRTENPAAVAEDQNALIQKYGLDATFLLRPDIIFDKETSEYFKKDNFKNQELGLFLEVTPSLLDRLNIPYVKGEKSDANIYFLSGYTQEQRKLIIDSIFSKFNEEYGYFPTSVGAWDVDAYSANYLSQKYGVTSIMLCADQYSTDRYKIWGSWWGVPYYPSKKNIIVPAQNKSEKINAVVTQWAMRDPVNGYGPGYESSYSVQPNDYTTKTIGQDTTYFKKLLGVYFAHNDASYGFVSIGLENELYPGNGEFENQLAIVSQMSKAGQIDVLTMSGFAKWYIDTFPKLSEEKTVTAQDFVDDKGKATWINTNSYRMGLLTKDGKTFLRDLRFYNSAPAENYLLASNLSQSLSLVIPAVVDSVKNPDQKQDVTGLTPSQVVKMFKSKNMSTSIYIYISFAVGILLGLFLIKKYWERIKENKLLSLIIFLGTLVWSATMVKSGLVYSYGMGFWGPNGHDGIWHIALINHFANGDFNMPVFAEEGLKNYHIGFDFIVALVQRLTTIPALELYFQVIPPLMAFFVGFLTYKFVKEWRNSNVQAVWATFFMYFGGSWGWLINLLRGNGITGESMFWSQQAISTLVNPPFALSLIVMLLGLIYTLRFIKKESTSILLPAFLFGILIEVKVYAGLLALGGLLVVGLWQFFKNRKSEVAKLFLASFGVAVILFLALNRQSVSLVVFKPLWFLETMMGLSDRLGWTKFYSAMTNYRLAGQWVKAFMAYGLAFLVFWFGNLGTRVVKEPLLFGWIKNYKKLGFVEIFLSSVIVAGVVMPMLFLQRGTPWNTIQFIYYSLAFSGILAGVYLGEYIEKNKSLLFPVVVVLLTLPTTLGTLMQYLPSRPPAMLSNDEISALAFLENQSNGTVLTYPYDEKKAQEAISRPPRPLYLYESTAYVAALSGKAVYLEDQVNLDITGYDWQTRRAKEEDFLNTLDQDRARNFLKDNNITYVYWIKGQRAKLGETQLGLEKIYENETVDIFKVSLD